MKKIIDFDKMFEKAVHSFIAKNSGKYSEETLENKIAELYDKFCRKTFDELGGLCPEEYYKTFTSEEKITALKESVEKGISVSDYLCVAISSDKGCEELLIRLLDGKNEELTAYAINLLGDMGSVSVLKKYLIMAVEGSIIGTVPELICEKLSENADIVRDAILAAYPKLDEYHKAYFAEVLANCKNKDDRILAILLDEFLIHPENVGEYANLLVKYGDDRALDVLYKELEKEELGFVDYRELTFAIEALGGKVENKRDFSKDKDFIKVRIQSDKERKNQAKKGLF